MTQTEALKLALEALEWCHGGEPCGTAEAITAIKEALAQPEEQHSCDKQEPVAWITGTGELLKNDMPLSHWMAWWTPLYTTPPQRTWIGLTEEEVIDLWPDLIMHRHTYQFWQNLEAKLKAKNGFNSTEKNT